MTPFNPLDAHVVAETESIVKKDIEGVYDFMTYDGDPGLFMRSDIASKDLYWCIAEVKFEDIKKIYESLGMQINRNGVMNVKSKDSFAG